jgi:hypothetical protein
MAIAFAACSGGNDRLRRDDFFSATSMQRAPKAVNPERNCLHSKKNATVREFD